ncbi:hypothetical protein [Streptomyces sp. SID3212]|uniref:hypothetical protein n=1 Tax=Streptomyces sp. SID3212 TaxID=2690259 RepID=UPI0013711F76|nr:hypothetical protein [Streptomyces sp. SID3212]MYV52711.1 hypothetical protein [Streptomyces sp. SID3212]
MSEYSARLPIASFSFTQSEDSVIKAAEAEIVSRCMERFGFEYIEPAPVPSFEGDGSDDRRYGIMNLKLAEKYGYHAAPGVPIPRDSLQKDAASVLFGSLEPYPTGKIVTEYHGTKVPKGGCRGEAFQQVEAPFEPGDDASAAYEISVRSFTESMHKTRVVKVFRAWSSCMERYGYTYKMPLDPLNDRDFLGEAEANSVEIQTAVADVKCKNSTNLPAVWFAAESDIQRAKIANSESRLSRLRVNHAKELENARRIITNG